jgi:hypothetical protein
VILRRQIGQLAMQDEPPKGAGGQQDRTEQPVQDEQGEAGAGQRGGKGDADHNQGHACPELQPEHERHQQREQRDMRADEGHQHHLAAIAKPSHPAQDIVD